MPAAGATAKMPSPPDRAELPPSPDRHEPASPPDHDPVRETKLRQVEPMAAGWADQDAELDAEIAALEAIGALTVPAEEEQPGSALDPDGAAPHGLRAWLADLSGSSIDDCPAVPVDATDPRLMRTERRDRAGGGATGFAGGGDADLLSPGAA